MDFATRVGAYCWIENEGSVLLAHWSQTTADGGVYERWTLPGGGVEWAESLPQTAIREAREETGHEVRLDHLLTVFNFFVPQGQRLVEGPPLHYVQVVYAATVIGGQLTRERGGSTNDVRWFTRDEISTLEVAPVVDAMMVATAAS